MNEQIKQLLNKKKKSNYIFVSIPNYLPEDAVIIPVCNKNDTLTEVISAPNKNETLYFIVKRDFDSAKVMVWNAFEGLTTICKAENIEIAK